MPDVPDPGRHIPTPGAHHLDKVPKWAWLAGGAGLVGTLILVEHKRAGDKAAETDAMNAPGDTTADDSAMTVDSPVASPYGDPYAVDTNGGTSYPLPRGEAPIVIGDPPSPDLGLVSADAGGSEQLPPTALNIQVGPIQDQGPRTGGGSAKGRTHTAKKPATTHHGAAGHKAHHKTNKNGQKPGHHAATTKNSGHGVHHSTKAAPHPPPKPHHNPPPKPVVKKKKK